LLKLTLSAIKAGYDKATRQHMVAANSPVSAILAQFCQPSSQIVVHTISLMPTVTLKRLNSKRLAVEGHTSQLGVTAIISYDQRSKIQGDSIFDRWS
jgi:hypothetical protein